MQVQHLWEEREGRLVRKTSDCNTLLRKSQAGRGAFREQKLSFRYGWEWADFSRQPQGEAWPPRSQRGSSWTYWAAMLPIAGSLNLSSTPLWLACPVTQFYALKNNFPLLMCPPHLYFLSQFMATPFPWPLRNLHHPSLSPFLTPFTITSDWFYLIMYFPTPPVLFAASVLIQFFIISSLDYCNYLLMG